jgi:hypothetical protein
MTRNAKRRSATNTFAARSPVLFSTDTPGNRRNDSAYRKTKTRQPETPFHPAGSARFASTNASTNTGRNGQADHRFPAGSY